MFHPVGSQPPSVYWRRRLLTGGALIILVVLIVVTVSALTSGGSGSQSGGPTNTPLAGGHSSSTPPTTSRHPTRTASRSTSTGSGSSSPTGAGPSTGGSSSAAVTQCRSADLEIAASVAKETYRVGQDPMVGLKVTNVGSAPCVQDLADKQVVLKVYNGVSRVWGSHDCQIQPGTKDLTLAVRTPVLASVSWSGETSHPKCAGTRQHVGAGTYTLIATLAGKTGTAARFTIG